MSFGTSRFTDHNFLRHLTAVLGLVGLLAAALAPTASPAQPSLVTDAFSKLVDIESESVVYTHGGTTELCFASSEGVDGETLFCYDGSTLRQVSGRVSSLGNLGTEEDAFVVYDGALYFGAEGNDGEGEELWQYDGSAVSQVDDINSGSADSNPRSFEVYDGSLYFTADDGSDGDELWRYTSGDYGAEQVDNIDDSGTDSSPAWLTVYNGTLYFSADGGSDGDELWSYTAGDNSATQVDDINGADDSYPSWLTVYDGALYFGADGGTEGDELWRYDDSNTSASKVDDINGGSSGSSPRELAVYYDGLYFSAYDGSDRELWRYNSLNTSASEVDDINTSGSSSPRSLTVYDGSLFFRADDGSSNRKLLRYDSGDAEASVAADITYDNAVNVENGLTVFDPGSGEKLYFDAEDQNDSNIGRGLYSYDGPNATLAAETNTVTATMGSLPNLTSYNGALYFFASDSESGTGLWKYESGSVSLVDNSFFAPDELTVYDGTLYFRAGTFSEGRELWKSDGTASGTELVEDLNPGSSDAWPRSLTVYDGELYFGADNGSVGRELFVYDGTDILRVEDISSGSSSPRHLTVYDGELYFRAADGSGTGYELYKSDGRSAYLVANLNSSGGSAPSELTTFNDQLYFQATNGSDGRELFVYDASQDQADQVKDINSGSGDSSPSNLTVYDNTLYFQADDGSVGDELFKLEGGLVSNVDDINAGSASSQPKDFAVFNDRLYFNAFTEEEGREPHGYDGSSVTTIDLHDGTPSSGGFSPAKFDDGSGTKLYVVANDGQSGTELWSFDQNSAPLPVELASLEASQTRTSAAQISWTTASEQNNAGFRVQHKTEEAASWSKVGYVESNASGGTTTEMNTYRFTAENLSVGTHQFRLHQVDLDGTTHVHDPVSVKLQMKEALRLSAPAPNPAQNQARLSFAVKEQVETTLILYNVLGQKVRTLYEGTPAAGEARTTPLDVSTLSSGVYILRLQAEGKAKTRKFTVVQ